jgi:hypothetical protein
VTNSSAVGIGNAGVTALTFDTEQFDLDNMHSGATLPSRLTINTPGYYLFVGNVAFAANAVGLRRVAVRLNGATLIGEIQILGLTAGVAAEYNVSAIYGMTTNDYAELVVRQDSGATLNTATNPDASPSFSAMLIK